MKANSEPTIYVHQQNPLPRYPTYVATCCRDWTLAMGFPVGSCGLCGERPVKKES